MTTAFAGLGGGEGAGAYGGRDWPEGGGASRFRGQRRGGLVASVLKLHISSGTLTVIERPCALCERPCALCARVRAGHARRRAQTGRGLLVRGGPYVNGRVLRGRRAAAVRHGGRG
jgi:hypothetical protein